MSSAQVIDALFERTVDIVQSLPKTGPIQTSYEEKLALYSLYKQATEGNVNSKRPGMLDMLGRAKWDAWANRRGLASQDAKQLYVESMLKTLRKFSDRPQAMALIEELESFSGDVAQRVMSASLARADTDSEASSIDASPRLRAQRASYEHDEDERDAIAQLPRGGMTPRGGSAGLRAGHRTPMSVGDASAMAVRGGDAADSRTGDSDTEDGLGGRDDSVRARPGSGLAGSVAAGRSLQTALAQQRRPQPSTWQQQQHQRGSGSITAHSERPLYAPPNAARYPGPSASEAGAMMGGGAGASLYSAVGPSARPTPSEQHYYHHHGSVGQGAVGSSRAYATSSIGGRSVTGPIGGPSRTRIGGSSDADIALQSIQASLAALHERLNRVETRRTGLSGGDGRAGIGGGSGPGRRGGALAAGYRAVADALHDIAVLLGLRSDGRVGAAPPSTYAESVASRGAGPVTSHRAHREGRRIPQALGAFLRLSIALVNLAMRIALDATSVAVVLSVLLFLLKRITGRGDPLIILRLLRRWTTAGAIGGAATGGTAAAAALQNALSDAAGTSSEKSRQGARS